MVGVKICDESIQWSIRVWKISIQEFRALSCTPGSTWPCKLYLILCYPHTPPLPMPFFFSSFKSFGISRLGLALDKVQWGSVKQSNFSQVPLCVWNWHSDETFGGKMGWRSTISWVNFVVLIRAVKTFGIGRQISPRRWRCGSGGNGSRKKCPVIQDFYDQGVASWIKLEIKYALEAPRGLIQRDTKGICGKFPGLRWKNEVRK